MQTPKISLILIRAAFNINGRSLYLVHGSNTQRVVLAPRNRFELPRELRVIVLREAGHEGVGRAVLEERLPVGSVEQLNDVKLCSRSIVGGGSFASQLRIGQASQQAEAVLLRAIPSKHLEEDLDIRLWGEALDAPDKRPE